MSRAQEGGGCKPLAYLSGLRQHANDPTNFADFASWIHSPVSQFRADEVYKNQTEWTRMSIMATAGGGKFSTDRTIAEYARDIWHAEPCQVPQPEAKSKSKPASS